MREREIQYQGGDVTALLNGAGDPLVPKDELQAFEKEMLAAGVDDKVANFPGGKHAFTHPAASGARQEVRSAANKTPRSTSHPGARRSFS